MYVKGKRNKRPSEIKFKLKVSYSGQPLPAKHQ